MTNDVLWLRRKEDNVSVDKVDFPLFIQAESPEGPLRSIESFIELRTAGNGYFDHPDMQMTYRRRDLLFVLGNAELRTRTDNQNSGIEGDIQVLHPYAKDDEGDTTRVANFTVSGLQFGMANSGTFVFTGWLTDMRFYAPGVEGEYFTEHGGPDESDYENVKFPYQPPRVSIKKMHLPVQVEVVVYARGDYEAGEYWTDMKTQYDEQKAKAKK